MRRSEGAASDDIDFIAWRWAVQDRFVKSASRTTECFGLDPTLVEDIEDAVREQDTYGFYKGVERFSTALVVAVEDLLEDLE